MSSEEEWGLANRLYTDNQNIDHVTKDELALIYMMERDELIVLAREILGSTIEAVHTVNQAFEQTHSALERGIDITNIVGWLRRHVCNLANQNRSHRQVRDRLQII